MNNQELELKVKKILEIENFFDMIIAVKEFEKEYKGSDFFKATKMSLTDVIRDAKMWYALQFNNLIEKAQEFLDNLNLDSVNQVVNALGDTFDKENADLLAIAKEMSLVFKK